MKIREIENILSNKFGKRFISEIKDDSYEIKNLVTDSRNHFNTAESLFFAIKTPGGNDGHNYLKSLYDKGVRNFIVQAIPESLTKAENTNFFIVDNTISALQEIGKAHRERAKEMVAITGSRGKTTVKEMIFQMMEPYKKISRSPRSFNSQIGVPLSLWLISPDSDLALIEAGISRKGEMHTLTETIDPDTVILTNIGEAHSSGFVSQQEKAEEKILLTKGEKVKTIIYSLDNKFFYNLLKDSDKRKKTITWSISRPDADLYIQKTASGIDYQWKGEKFHLDVEIEKDFDIENIGNTLAFMLKENLPSNKIEESFKRFHNIKTRLNVSEGVNGCSIIQDNYTSDLSSLQPAIDFMSRRKMPWQTETLIISDLHHEAQRAEATYREMSHILKEAGINKLIGIGETIKKYSHFFPQGSVFYNSTENFLKDFRASDYNDEIILLKGGTEFNFDAIFGQLEAKKHETVLEVNLDALLRNYNYFKSNVPSSTGIIAMVKASGYGAGSYEIAKTLQDAGASYLAVAALDEGTDLRKNGIIMPIMVMNPRAANYKGLFYNKLEPVIYSMNMLHSLSEEAEKYGWKDYPVHIKLDTGMHRMGFEEDEIENLINLLAKSKNIKVTSIFSHLATADCVDMDFFTYRQLEKFEKMSNQIISNLNYPVKRHILNSAGILRFPAYHYDLVRLGIGLYGANTLPDEMEKPLATVSTLRSVIICLREVEGDEAVGYGRNGKIHGKTKIATIPVGYADGMNRKFGNGAIKVLVKGEEAPTIGNICMDATMLDVTDIKCEEGDPVEIFGETMSLQRLADTLGTIPYEVLTSVSPRVKRVYYRE